MEPSQPGLKISAVPPEYVHMAWPQAAPYLEKALERAPGRFTAGDLFMLLAHGQQLLWVIMDGDTIVGAVTTRIYDVPRSKIAAVEWVGGERGFEWFDQFLEVFENWAKDCGCNKLEGHGRKGWLNVVKPHGWHWLAESYEKDL